MKTSLETKKTLAAIARLSYSNFDNLSDEDKHFAMLLAAQNVRTFIRAWEPSPEISNFFEWSLVPIAIVKEAFAKLLEDIDREFSDEVMG